MVYFWVTFILVTILSYQSLALLQDEEFLEELCSTDARGEITKLLGENSDVIAVGYVINVDEEQDLNTEISVFCLLKGQASDISQSGIINLKLGSDKCKSKNDLSKQKADYAWIFYMTKASDGTLEILSRGIQDGFREQASYIKENCWSQLTNIVTSYPSWCTKCNELCQPFHNPKCPQNNKTTINPSENTTPEIKLGVVSCIGPSCGCITLFVNKWLVAFLLLTIVKFVSV